MPSAAKIQLDHLIHNGLITQWMVCIVHPYGCNVQEQRPPGFPPTSLYDNRVGPGSMKVAAAKLAATQEGGSIKSLQSRSTEIQLAKMNLGNLTQALVHDTDAGCKSPSSSTVDITCSTLQNKSHAQL